MDAVDASPPCLVDLPRGVLDQIFLRIARADVKRVSLVNRRFRLRIRYYLFQKVHGMWAQFLQLRSLGTRPEWLNHIREIPILSPEATYEHLRDALSHVADNLDDETAPLVRLRTLKLDNCSWEYPFNLASFNQNNTLRTLRVFYSHDNTFVLLERYEDYLRHSFQGHSASLLHISFAFVDSHMYTSHLSPIILKTFL
ncbi:hypothetical protein METBISCDRAFT_28715, partial [Metschnikowia bicuspidata]